MLRITSRSLEQFHDDLEAAGIEAVTDEGHLDLHALRRTYCERLRDAAADTKTTQALMRHGSPEMVMRYQSDDPDRKRAAVARMTRLTVSAKEPPRPQAGDAESIDGGGRCQVGSGGSEPRPPQVRLLPPQLHPVSIPTVPVGPDPGRARPPGLLSPGAAGIVLERRSLVGAVRITFGGPRAWTTADLG